jgi:hypothetical protein
MSKCNFHPGRESVKTINGRSYCQECKTGIAGAVNQVDRHVEPKDCFVWYQKSNTWVPIPGTGCAHWVAHQLGLRNVGYGDKCLEGFAYRIPDLIQGKAIVTLDKVQVNDIYVISDGSHTGLVSKVKPANPKTGSALQISIMHDSSRQGQVAENDFSTYFKGKGKFYR